MSWSAFGGIRRATFDNAAGVVEIVGADGRLLRARHPLMTKTLGLGLPDDFDRLSLDIASKILSLALPSGEDVEIEFFDQDDDMESRRAGRPAVYLDQNKWVALAQSIHSPHRLSAEDRNACQDLMRLVEAGEIVVLLSSAHMLETGRTDGAWREHLAPLMLRLSRGWVLRDPLLVRHEELSTMLAAHAGLSVPPLPKITLDPDAMYSDLPLLGEATPVRRLPSSAGLDDVADVLGHVASIYSVLLENMKIISPDGETATEGWAEWQAAISRASAENRATVADLRRYTLTMFLRDLAHDIALAAARVRATDDHLEAWVFGCDESLTRAPYLSRVRELMHRRHANPAERWEPNDLVDVIYLPLATAFADVAVMEQKGAHYLRLVQRDRDDGAVVVTSMSAAVEALREI
jgi:hypothetical protein